MDEEETASCPVCSISLEEPFIQCVECLPNISLCLHCFAKGVEFNNHNSDHAYTILRKDFPLFIDQWTAEEEEKLLCLIYENGYGNWNDIAQQVKTKTSVECENHYNKYYVEKPEPPLPKFPEPEISYFPSPIMFKLSDDPPRPAEGSSLFLDMAGYMAARSDFLIEHDNFAELELFHLEFDSEADDPLEDELKLTALDVYNNCLKERMRRKRIIRDYGLINPRKVADSFRGFKTSFRHFIDGLRVFTRLMTPMNADLLFESLNCEQELRNDIIKLQQYRRNGLTKFRQIKIYSNLKVRRHVMLTKRHLLDDLLMHVEDESACQLWLNRQTAVDNLAKGGSLVLPSAPRKSAPPLDIIGLAGYEKLLQTEKDLCASVRLNPESYLSFKKILIDECCKLGSLKLAQARTLIKIDVNKTRKLYDYLILEGIVNKDPI